MMKPFVWLFAALAAAATAMPAPVAQEEPGCRRIQTSDPPRSVYECAGGLVVEAEAAAELIFDGPPEGTTPDGLALESGAVLIERGGPPQPFQVRTPHAVAAVRGTTFAVDAEDGRTAVFVIEGAVAVSPPDGGDGVRLADGEGTDVVPGRELDVRRWPRERVAALLARFGR